LNLSFTTGDQFSLERPPVYIIQKNWSRGMVLYPSTTGWSDNHSGVLCSIPIHPLVITDDWRRITRSLLSIKIVL